MKTIERNNTTTHYDQPSITDCRPAFGAPVPISDARCVCIAPAELTPESITEAALTARLALQRGEMDESDSECSRRNGVIVGHNASVLFGGDESALIVPVKTNRVRAHRKQSVARGFRFTVAGLDGVYKLNPLRRIG